MSVAESEICQSMAYGSGLQAAAQLADVCYSDALFWCEWGEAYPSGEHAAFARELKRLEAINAMALTRAILRSGV